MLFVASLLCLASSLLRSYALQIPAVGDVSLVNADEPERTQIDCRCSMQTHLDWRCSMQTTRRKKATQFVYIMHARSDVLDGSARSDVLDGSLNEHDKTHAD
jgi:hypothetical protein